MKRIFIGGLTILFASACVAQATKPSGPAPVWSPDSVWEEVEVRRPRQFRMVHQVAVRFQGGTRVIIGHLLAEGSGDFHLIASAPLGPRLFELAKAGDEVRAKTSVEELQGQVDPKNVASAIDLIYFAQCPKGTGLQVKNEILYRCRPATKLHDLDEAEVKVNPNQLTVIGKEFRNHGKTLVTIDYRDFVRHGDQIVARKIHFKHALGLSLDIALLQYESPYKFDRSQLQLSPD